jgi:hypothetical protein
VITRQFNLVILLSLCCFTQATTSAERQGEEYLLKAVFIYNFAKFTHWPVETLTKDTHSLQICSIGNDELANTLARLHGMTLKDHPVNIKHKEVNSNLDTCHVLYLANSLQHKAIEIADSLNDTPILTISELPGFAEAGGMIELYQSDARIRFKVNLQVIRNAGLDLSSQLLKLAVIVDRQY